MSHSEVLSVRQGFGCMGMSAFYASAMSSTEDNNIAVFQEAVNRGVSLFNTATFYGPLNEEGYGANLRLLCKCLDHVDRSKIQLMVKVGMNTRSGGFVNEGTADGIRSDVEYALHTLGVDYIDIVVLCRIPSDIPLEESMRGLQAVVAEGKAKSIGLSEASAKTIRKAHFLCPIQYIEQEWSMYARDIEEEIVPTCRELGIKIVAYSPLGRGFLTGAIQSLEQLDSTDYRASMPKFSPENFAKNKKILDSIAEFAERKGCKPGQLALAWLLKQGPDIIPIPGTTSTAHLLDNIQSEAVVLSSSDLEEIEAILSQNPVAGDRYAHMAITFHGNR